MRSRKIVVAGFVAGARSLGAAPALAHSASSPDGGSYVYSTGKTLYVKDTKADKHAAYGYANGTATRLNNNNGYNATVSRTYSFTITAVQACTDIPFGKDSCSNWQ